jgi:hypothetical protein
MNAKHEPSAEKKALVDSLLAIDRRMPTSSAEAREVTQKVLRRDRRRVRILTGATLGLFLLTVVGMCLSVYWYYIKVVPYAAKYEQDVAALERELAKREPKPSEPDLLAWTARSSRIQGSVLFKIQLANLWGILALFAIMLVAAVCTVLLIMATRGATLRQIQASLLALSEQFDALQQSIQGSRSSGGGP